MFISFISALLLATMVTVVASYHGWVKLYNKLALLITIKTRWNVNSKSVSQTPLLFHQEVNIFISSFVMSCVLFALIALSFHLGKVF